MDGRYAGVVWASQKHEVFVADAAGEKLLAATFAHGEKGLRSLCWQLVGLKVRLVAAWRPDGLLVERLLDAGLRVLVLHPNQVAAARDRFRVSGGKSDGFDAFVLCELARTDHHRFRVLELDSDATKAIRALTRGREGLVGARTALVTSCGPSLSASGPGRLACSAICIARSRSCSWSGIPARPPLHPAGLARQPGNQSGAQPQNPKHRAAHRRPPSRARARTSPSTPGP